MIEPFTVVSPEGDELDPPAWSPGRQALDSTRIRAFQRTARGLLLEEA